MSSINLPNLARMSHESLAVLLTSPSAASKLAIVDVRDSGSSPTLRLYIMFTVSTNPGRGSRPHRRPHPLLHLGAELRTRRPHPRTDPHPGRQRESGLPLRPQPATRAERRIAVRARAPEAGARGRAAKAGGVCAGGRVQHVAGQVWGGRSIDRGVGQGSLG